MYTVHLRSKTDSAAKTVCGRVTHHGRERRARAIREGDWDPAGRGSRSAPRCQCVGRLPVGFDLAILQKSLAPSPRWPHSFARKLCLPLLPLEDFCYFYWVTLLLQIMDVHASPSCLTLWLLVGMRGWGGGTGEGAGFRLFRFSGTWRKHFTRLMVGRRFWVDQYIQSTS